MFQLIIILFMGNIMGWNSYSVYRQQCWELYTSWTIINTIKYLN